MSPSQVNISSPSAHADSRHAICHAPRPRQFPIRYIVFAPDERETLPPSPRLFFEGRLRRHDSAASYLRQRTARDISERCRHVSCRLPADISFTPSAMPTRAHLFSPNTIVRRHGHSRMPPPEIPCCRDAAPTFFLSSSRHQIRESMLRHARQPLAIYGTL